MPTFLMQLCRWYNCQDEYRLLIMLNRQSGQEALSPVEAQAPRTMVERMDWEALVVQHFIQAENPGF
jgi:hypothetical protein